MTWSWSHTKEAYEYAYSRVFELDHLTLAEVAAEWRMKSIGLPIRKGFAPDLRKEQWERYKVEYLAMPKDIVAEYVWDHMREAANCSNGGWRAYVDPEGWVTVPFGPEEEP